MLEYFDFPTPSSITPTLQYSPSERKLNYDFHRHPSTATTYPDDLPLSFRDRSRSATNPSLPFLRIACPLFFEPIAVLPSMPHLGVTVDDVLIALHLYFAATASFREFQVLAGDAQDRVNAAFQRRVERCGGQQEQENERLIGVRRVDFLMGRSRFLGLSHSSDDPQLFVLNVC
jgi:hypothetical protein